MTILDALVSCLTARTTDAETLYDVYGGHVATYRAQLAFKTDTDFPRDAMSMNPHYTGENPQALADKLKANLIAHPSVGAQWGFTIKVYDALKAPPSYPLATATLDMPKRDTGKPREVAMCLSYYSGFNRPSLRGRLYIPGGFITGAQGLKPSQAQIDEVLSWKDVFTVGVSTAIWVVYSRKHKTSSVVDHCWVDNEWDTIRTRGLRSELRTATAIAQP